MFPSWSFASALEAKCSLRDKKRYRQLNNTQLLSVLLHWQPDDSRGSEREIQKRTPLSLIPRVPASAAPCVCADLDNDQNTEI